MDKNKLQSTKPLYADTAFHKADFPRNSSAGAYKAAGRSTCQRRDCTGKVIFVYLE